MTPKQSYQKDIDSGDLQPDTAQAQAVEALDALYHALQRYAPIPQEEVKGWKKWFGKKSLTPQIDVPKGLYFWGGVGRGKTYLMDTFYHSLPGERKMRVHFHRFMLRVHQELGRLKGESDPLKQVADIFKKETDIICFDEFFVSDITDAMILSTLFEALFERQIILVATSNIPPQDLYRNGLQRARFLPTIALIEKNCDVLNVDSGVDYRLRTLEKAQIFHAPAAEGSLQILADYFQQLTPLHEEVAKTIDINKRDISVIGASQGVLFASFSQLCETTRSQNDYIELATLYHSVILADVQVMGAGNDDAARRFIALVDEFYERHVKLIMSAQVAIEHLYQGGQLDFEFKRCLSRLTEMQSQEYLQREHLL